MYDSFCNSLGTVTISAEGDILIGLLWLKEHDELHEEITLVLSVIFYLCHFKRSTCPNLEPAK